MYVVVVVGIAIDAGLEKVPCIIRSDIDNLTATGLSIMENAHRSEIPPWRYALKIGEMYQQLSDEEYPLQKDRIGVIMRLTGFKQTSVRNYIEISGLPSEIIELMKTPEKRSISVKELLKQRSLMISEEDILSVDKAVYIARHLRGVSRDRMFNAAVYVLSMSKQSAFSIVDKVREYPKMSMGDIHDMIRQELPKGVKWMFMFDSRVLGALNDAALRYQIEAKLVVPIYVERGLKEDGYLG